MSNKPSITFDTVRSKFSLEDVKEYFAFKGLEADRCEFLQKIRDAISNEVYRLNGKFIIYTVKRAFMPYSATQG